MATSTRKAGVKATTPGNTQDIPHEEIPIKAPPGKVGKQELRILTQDEMVELELRKLSPAEQKLQELITRFKDLTVAGPDDKEGYRLAKEAWRELLTFRTGVENTALGIRRDYTAINKAISSKEAQIVAAAKPHEERLQKLWKDVDEARAKAEKEEEQRLEDQLNERLGQLTNLGAKYDDGYYVVGSTVTFDVATLRTMTGEKFEKLKAVVVEAAAEVKRKEDEERERQQQELKRQEHERLEARKAIKESRSMVLDALGLVAQSDGTLLWTDGVHRLVESEEKLYDLDHYGFTEHVKIIKANIKDFQEAKGRQEREDKEREEREARKRRDGSRIYAIQQAGLQPSGEYFVHHDGFNEPLRVGFDELLELEDKEFSNRVIELSNEMAARRARLNAHKDQVAEEARQRKLRQDTIAKVLQDLGFKYEYTRETFEFNHPLYSVTFHWNDLLGLDDEALEHLRQEQAELITDARHRQDVADRQERERLERERQAGLTDAQTFKEYLDKLRALAAPTLKTAVGRKRAAEFANRLGGLIAEFEPKGAKKEVAS